MSGLGVHRVAGYRPFGAGTVGSGAPLRSESVNQPMSCISASVVSNGAIRLWVRSALIAGSISRFREATVSKCEIDDPPKTGNGA